MTVLSPCGTRDRPTGRVRATVLRNAGYSAGTGNFRAPSPGSRRSGGRESNHSGRRSVCRTRGIAGGLWARSNSLIELVGPAAGVLAGAAGLAGFVDDQEAAVVAARPPVDVAVDLGPVLADEPR